MTTVDSKGRIVLPQELRERLNIAPGEEVEVHEEDGRVVVEPKPDPGQVLEQMEELVTGISDRQHAPYDELDPQSRAQVDAIRRQADSENE